VSGRLNVWLLVLVAVCGVSYWFGKDLVLPTGSSDSQDKRAVQPADQYELPDDETAIHLVVLNGTEKSGLARDVSLLLGRAGCVAESVGNAPHRFYPESFLVNRRLTERRAEDLASLLGGVPVLREMDGRGTEDAVLVLGNDWGQLTSVLERVGGDGRP
jgi:hypothetical protein